MGDHHLTVLRDFGPYKCGDHIEDDAEVARIIGGELCRHVVKVHAEVMPNEEPKTPASAPSAPSSALPTAKSGE
jgi:hypothetical protein